MVFLSDQQLDCRHVVGVTTRGHTAYLIYADRYLFDTDMHGAVMFSYCPFCSAPVPQLLSEVDE